MSKTKMNGMVDPPTDDQIVQAFRDWIDGRCALGNMYTQSVSDLAFDDGRVTVTLDPSLSGAQHWALLDKQAPHMPSVFGSPVSDDSRRGHWLRRRVERVIVQDVDGRMLGQVTTGELLWPNLLRL